MKLISYIIAAAFLVGGTAALAQTGMRLGYQHLELHEDAKTGVQVPQTWPKIRSVKTWAAAKPLPCPKAGCGAQGTVTTVTLRKVPSVAEMRQQQARIAAISDSRVYTEARRGGVTYVVVKP